MGRHFFKVLPDPHNNAAFGFVSVAVIPRFRNSRPCAIISSRNLQPVRLVQGKFAGIYTTFKKV
jgi:hypothetical protein